MAQPVRGANAYMGSVLRQCATKLMLLRQSATSANQRPSAELVLACYDGDEATVQCYVQGNDVNLDYQVSQVLHTLSPTHTYVYAFDRFHELLCSL
jgi:hypothetical protein